MLSDGVSEHQILKIFLGGMPPDPPTWNAHEVFTAFGGSAPPSRQMFLHLCIYIGINQNTVTLLYIATK